MENFTDLQLLFSGERGLLKYILICTWKKKWNFSWLSFKLWLRASG